MSVSTIPIQLRRTRGADCHEGSRQRSAISYQRLGRVSGFRPNGPDKSHSQGQRPWSTRPTTGSGLKGRPFEESLATEANGRAVGPEVRGACRSPRPLAWAVGTSGPLGRKSGPLTRSMASRSSGSGAVPNRGSDNRTVFDRRVISHSPPAISHRQFLPQGSLVKAAPRSARCGRCCTACKPIRRWRLCL